MPSGRYRQTECVQRRAGETLPGRPTSTEALCTFFKPAAWGREFPGPREVLGAITPTSVDVPALYRGKSDLGLVCVPRWNASSLTFSVRSMCVKVRAIES